MPSRWYLLWAMIVSRRLVGAFHAGARSVRPAHKGAFVGPSLAPSAGSRLPTRVFTSTIDGDDAAKEAAKAAREARKEEKTAAKAAKAAEKAAALAAMEVAEAEADAADAVPISHLTLDQPDVPLFGNYATVMSQGVSSRHFLGITELVPAAVGEAPTTVWLRGRVQNVRAKGSSCFMVIRQGSFDTVQAVLFKDKVR